MTLAKVTPVDEYHVDEHGLIDSPGKFEGEAAYVPSFWALGLEGGADEDTYGERDVEVIEEELAKAAVFVFHLTDEDKKRWPALADVERLELWESGNGFVYCDRLPQDGSFNEKNAAAL
jgi:hypothetical protein